LLELINDILDISKINAGKMEISFEPVDLASMIESVMSTALGFVKDKPIKLRTDVPEGLPTVIADGRRVRQVLTNLLGNAGKFTEEGYIKIAATYDDYQVIINVEDTGIGIPPERIHAVFEQFEQVDSSSTRRYGGTGLGVPLSREFVRMHGGDMWIQESIVGKGTTFSFSLPIGGPDAAVGEPGGPPDAQTILAVDDDEGVITLFRRYLEDEGYRVFGLTKGERVVEEAKRLKPYAITLDVMMPEEDGWSVIRRLKADPETRDIPVIICSILSDRDKGLSMGVADYLVKPISEHDLLDALDRVEISQEGHVLVVDDNADDRKLLRRILENGAIEVMEAEGGQAAIEHIHDDPPELVVLDLMMPDVDGFAVLEHLKSDQETRQIPVIVVTAKELTPEMRARLQQRVESLLQKGIFDQEQLLADVSDALHRLSVTHKDQVPD
jgi:CheY-like chemotaxis protein